METWYFVLSVGVSVLLFMLAILGLQRGWLVVSTHSDERIAELEQKIKWLMEERNQLITKVLELEKKERKLQITIAELQSNAGISNEEHDPEPMVLGIWPDSNLNIEGEKSAVYDSGFRYRALVGEKVRRTSILRELRTGDIDIIEIGAHGDENGVQVNGQNYSAGWWVNALKGRGVQIALLLSCASDSSISNAFKNAGVSHVIAIDGIINDESAVEFARQFYQLYAGGLMVDEAVQEAKLALDNEDAEMVVLR